MSAAKPTFLKVAQVGALVLGSFGVLGSVGSLLFARYMPDEYSVDGRHEPVAQLWGVIGPTLAYLAIALGMLTLAWALRRERRWARPLLLGLACLLVTVPFGFAVAFDVPTRAFLPQAGAAALTLGLLAWRLYFDDDILAYYSALEDESR